jgi:hypothetical protein
MSALKKILLAARRPFLRWRALAALTIVYASLLGALFLFVAMKEAAVWQIILTLICAALAPALFFILQAMIMSYARGEGRALVLLKRSLEDSCKLALASLPVALLGLLLFYLLHKLQAYYPAQVQPQVRTLQSGWSELQGGARSISPPLRWPVAALSTIRLMVFGIVLPLIAIRLWSATLREGLFKALKRPHRHVIRAFAPEAVRVYAAGLVLFGLVPYLLLFMHTPGSRPSTEFGLFIARLFLVFVFTLFGWTLTLCSLARSARGEDTAARPLEREQPLCEAEL